jgi:hypothetical protein
VILVLGEQTLTTSKENLVKALVQVRQRWIDETGAGDMFSLSERQSGPGDFGYSSYEPASSLFLCCCCALLGIRNKRGETWVTVKWLQIIFFFYYQIALDG